MAVNEDIIYPSTITEEINLRQHTQKQDGVAVSFGWNNFPIVGRSDVPPFFSNKTNLPAYDVEAPPIIESSDSEGEAEKELYGSHISFPKDRNERHVRFSSVQVREYAITLGVHPLADAYPVSLDWSHGDTRVVDIEKYDESRSKRKMTRSITQALPCRLDFIKRRARLAEVTGKTLWELDDEERLRKQVKATDVLEVLKSQSRLEIV
jgi:hypothetical protein